MAAESNPSAPPSVVVLNGGESDSPEAAERLAQRLGFPRFSNRETAWRAGHTHALVPEPQGLALTPLRPGGPGAVRAELTRGAMGRRLKSGGGGRREALVKAVSTRKRLPDKVVDATGGLGRDAAVLAAAGCHVLMLERSPVVAALVRDALERARGEPGFQPLVERLTLIECQAGDWLSRSALGDERPEAVYLDPMYPQTRQSSAPKKEMQLFRALLGPDSDADALLAPALEAAVTKVVVKRPRHAHWLAGRAPHHHLDGSSSRFDVYFRHV